MSIKAMTLVWDRFPGAGSELLVMLAFADWCDDRGENLYPSIPTVAKKIRASESQARRLVHGLINQGWVSVIGNEFGGSPGSSRQYRLNLAKLAETAGTSATPRTSATPSAHATPRTHATPSMDARDGSHGCAETPSTHARQTVIRSVKETTTTGSTLSWDALPQLSAEQRVVVEDQMEGLTADRRQDVLDELAGAFRAKAIKGQWPGWLHGVVQKAMKGGFKPNHALAIQAERKQRIEARELAAKRQAEDAERKKRNTDPTTQARRKAQFAAIEAALRP